MCRYGKARKGYEDKIDGLVELTYRSVEEHVSSEPSIVSAMAQRPNPSVKINASIAWVCPFQREIVS